MWIPTPSMTRAQRLLLYGTCAVALMNSVGLLVLLLRQNQQRASLERAEARLAEVEQSSVVEFLREAPRGAAGLRASRPDRDRDRDQYSRNKRSEELDKETQRELHQEEVQELHPQEASQEVGEEAEKKTKMKHKQRHKTRVTEDVMTMMTYSMVPVRKRRLFITVFRTNGPCDQQSSDWSTAAKCYHNTGVSLHNDTPVLCNDTDVLINNNTGVLLHKNTPDLKSIIKIFGL